MRKLLLLLILSRTSLMFGFQIYQRGNVLLGVGLGAGSPDILPTTATHFNVHPYIECIVGSWNRVALGLVGDFSVNIGGISFKQITDTFRVSDRYFTPFAQKTVIIATSAPMISLHTAIFSRLDWYVSLGAGFQLLPPYGTIGLYTILVGFATGFNILISNTVFWNIGMAIHSRQIFGSTGLAYRFGRGTEKIRDTEM